MAIRNFTPPEPRAALSQRQLFTLVRELGLNIRVLDGEYRVNFRGGRQATAYYTTDREDAFNTARAMLTFPQGWRK